MPWEKKAEAVLLNSRKRRQKLATMVTKAKEAFDAGLAAPAA